MKPHDRSYGTHDVIVAMVLFAFTAVAAQAAVNAAREPGTVASGGNPTAAFVDGALNNNCYFINSRYGLSFDRLSSLERVTYADNTDNRVAEVGYRYGAGSEHQFTDTSTGSGDAGSVVQMTNTVTGLAGAFVFRVAVFDTSNGGGAELESWGEATAALRLTNVSIVASGPSSTNPSNVLDRSLVTEWYALGGGANTYMDFDLGEPTRVGYFEIVHREGDRVNTFDLIFSDDTSFGDAGDITVTVNSGGHYTDLVDLAARGHTDGITKRYVRYDVTSTAGGGNQGGYAINFYDLAPSPAPEPPPEGEVNAARESGTVVSGGNPPAAFVDTILNNNCYFINAYYGVSFDRLYELTRAVYVDNTDNRVAAVGYRYGAGTNLVITDASTGDGTLANVVTMTNALSGLAGTFAYLVATNEPGQSNGGGGELEVYGVATECPRIGSVAILASGPNSSNPSNVLDRSLSTEWYALSGGVNTYMDFDVGPGQRIGYFEIFHRRSDRVNTFDLVFSDDTSFGDAGDITLSHSSGGNYSDLVDFTALGYPRGIEKRYVRYDVSATYSGSNQGGYAINFYEAYIPPPAGTVILLR